jgi:hypothetical protein
VKLDPLPRSRSLVVWRKYKINNRIIKNIRTICDILRELHRDAEDRGDRRAADLVDTAHDMAQRMQDKLKYYAYLHGGGGDKTIIRWDNKTLWISKRRLRKAEKMAQRAKDQK